MADKDLIPTMLKMLLRHNEMVHAFSLFMADHALLIERTLPRYCSCSSAATVRHAICNLWCCDHCAAREVYAARARGVMVDEGAGIDLPEAIPIRHVQDLISIALRGEPGGQLTPNQLH